MVSKSRASAAIVAKVGLMKTRTLPAHFPVEYAVVHESIVELTADGPSVSWKTVRKRDSGGKRKSSLASQSIRFVIAECSPQQSRRSRTGEAALHSSQSDPARTGRETRTVALEQPKNSLLSRPPAQS
jgi:hypothetical protein